MGSKYRNVRTTVNGITFHSKREAKRYLELRLLETAGRISHLKLQERFPLIVNGIKVCSYVADFSYVEDQKGHPHPIVEDTKGVRTSIYRLKAKLMRACYDIKIRET